MVQWTRRQPRRAQRWRVTQSLVRQGFQHGATLVKLSVAPFLLLQRGRFANFSGPRTGGIIGYGEHNPLALKSIPVSKTPPRDLSAPAADQTGDLRVSGAHRARATAVRTLGVNGLSDLADAAFVDHDDEGAPTPFLEFAQNLQPQSVLRAASVTRTTNMLGEAATTEEDAQRYYASTAA